MTNNLLATAVDQHGDRLALISSSSLFSYSDLYAASTETSVKLREMGVESGSCVAVICENSIDLVILLHALWQLGAVAAPINPKFPADYIETLLSDVGCEFTIRSNDLSAIVSYETKCPKSHLPPALLLDNPATIVYTSGSSARPKAAVHSLGNHYFSAIGANENIRITFKDRWLLSLPLYHVGGIGILFRTLLSGAAIVIPDKTKSVLEVIEEFRITHLSLVPTQLRRLLDRSAFTSNSRRPTVIIGGAKIPPNLARRATDAGLLIHTSYGLTEMASQVTTTAPGIAGEKMSGSGKLLTHRELMISGDGEILVRGKTLFCGYISQGQISLPVDEEGWFHTGDLGKLDESGNLSVSGRRDNMFLSGGENIRPERIESVMLEEFGFEQVMVVPVPSDEFGSRPVAFIKGEYDESILRQKMKKSLPGYEVPDAFYPWPEHFEIGTLKPNRKDFIRWAEKMGRNSD